MLEIKHENKSLYAITMRKTKFPIKSRKSTTLIELTILHQHWELILKK